MSDMDSPNTSILETLANELSSMKHLRLLLYEGARHIGGSTSRKTRSSGKVLREELQEQDESSDSERPSSERPWAF